MSNTLQAEMQAIREGAAFAPITDRAFLRITGSDATRWLNGMVTNSIQALQPGEGNYNFLLNAQGRIQGDCVIYREPGEGDPTLLLETGGWQLEAVTQTLDRYIIMDDVELTAIEATGLTIFGPEAYEVLCAAALPSSVSPAAKPEPSAFLGHMYSSLLLGRAFWTLQPPSEAGLTYEVWSPEASDISKLQSKLDELGALKLTTEALEVKRILSGTPRYGTDIRDRDLPQETNQTHALHFAKGCYLGQEIVERIRSRGQVHRLFTAFRLEGDLPTTLPATLEANGKPAGELTSATLVPMPGGDQLLALGYARREALDTNQTLTYAGGIALPRTP